MKHFLAALALAFTFSASAQTGLVEFPYNPDANGDDIIGVTDLLELLGLFGSEFSEENLYLNSDSTSALYLASSSAKYFSCHRLCNELPGNWRIASRNDFFETDISLLNQGLAWIRSDLPTGVPNTSDGQRSWKINIGFTNSSQGQIGYEDSSSSLNCYCAIHERPKVEYSLCEGYEIQSCAEAKVAEGWYPLGGVTNAYGGSMGTEMKQAFWRWAE